MVEFVCEQCDEGFAPDLPESVEVYVMPYDEDEAPLLFCSKGCAGVFLTDAAVA